MRLGIGIPNTGSIKALTAFALCRALKTFPHDYKLIFKEGSILHWNREEIVKSAIKNKCTHLLFLDTDMFFEEDAIVRLLRRKKDIIGVNSNTRRFPIETTVRYFRKSDKDKKGLMECESVATGFMLIDLKIFKKLTHPWFFWEVDAEGNTVTGEDYWLCKKAKELGYKTWVDNSIKVGHIGTLIY